MLLLRPAKERLEQGIQTFVRKFFVVVVVGGVGIGDDEEGEVDGSGRNYPQELGRPLHRLGQDVVQSWGPSSQVMLQGSFFPPIHDLLQPQPQPHLLFGLSHKGFFVLYGSFLASSALS